MDKLYDYHYDDLTIALLEIDELKKAGDKLAACLCRGDESADYECGADCAACIAVKEWNRAKKGYGMKTQTDGEVNPTAELELPLAIRDCLRAAEDRLLKEVLGYDIEDTGTVTFKNTVGDYLVVERKAVEE